MKDDITDRLYDGKSVEFPKYMTDEELLNFISDIEENDLVAAPPQMDIKVLERLDRKNQIIEYRRFRNRVVVSVAAILVITSLVPVWARMTPNNVSFRLPRLEYSHKYEISIFSDLGDSHYISDFFNRRED